MFSEKSDFDGVFKSLEFMSYGIPVRLMGFGIISHPVIQSCFVRKEDFDKDEDFQKQWHIIDDKTTPEKKNEYIELQLKRIKEASHGKIEAIFYLIHKPYRLELLDLSRDYLTKKDYTNLLIDSWTDVEFPHQMGAKRCVNMFLVADKKILAKKWGKNDFGDNIIIYRGLQGTKSKVKGLSWTTDLKIAQWFANRFSFKGKVYQAEISKEDIFLYTNSRSEKEVIVNPYKLRKIQEVTL